MTILVTFVALAAPVSGATLPAGFGDMLVATVGSPTAIAFTPDGRMLVTTQPGLLRVVQDGNLLPTPALDLSSQICSNSERGLLGVAVDPQFASNKFIYLYWTFNNTGSCPTGSFTSPVNRVTRYVLPDNNVISQSSEVKLLDNMPSTNGNHNGGDLNFGPDGNLYASIGDGGVQGESRKDHMLSGKILRITRDGAIPADNPNTGTGTARCNLTGRTASGTKCQETFATGLRNPFRFAFDPNSASPKFYINDVGQNTWEEIDLGQSGADYGYDLREGHCAFGSTTNCGTVAGLVNPIFDYGRATGCAAITGGAFVPNGLWGAPWDGKYLFSDYTCGKIFRLDPNGSGGFTMVEFVSGLLSSSAVHLEFGPFGSSQALYFTTYRDGGQVRRISLTSTPSAEMSASPTSGPAPLLVNFDGSASSDPNNDPLTFLWDFGDGNTETTTVPTTSHTYQTVGSFTATLRVRDPGGLTSLPASRTIQPGNSPPTVTMVSPAVGTKFAVGQSLTLSGTASDAQEGTLSASRLSWEVLRHHANHDHPYFSATGTGFNVVGPPPEDMAATTNSYLIVKLTATDSQGLSTTVTRTIQPFKVSIIVTTSPTGLNVFVKGVQYRAPIGFTSWKGWVFRVNTTSPQGSRVFVNWSDGGAKLHDIITPGTATTYTATFRVN